MLKMNAMISFFQDMFSGSTTNQKPIGLTSFKEQKPQQIKEKKKKQSKEVNLTELMRRH